jgi:hydroxymethylpyrimidine/phosphomethylpyrimidine kinase
VPPRVALTIAGSDSGGGAGIQADLKTFAAFGVFGTSAVTAVTAQNTTGVTAVHPVPPDVVEAQIRAVVSDLRPAAAKSGMLATPEIVELVARLVSAGEVPPLVVDPVLVSTSGDSLMGEGGVVAYRDRLLPLAVVATPNLPEAAALVGVPVDELGNIDAMVDVARTLRSFGTDVVVVKGGHLGRMPVTVPRRSDRSAEDEAGSPDVVAGPDGVEVLWTRRIPTDNDHGTGCTLSAAIAAGLALGDRPLDAVARAKDYVTRALAGAARWHLGQGHGPLDHFGWDDAAAPRPPGTR